MSNQDFLFLLAVLCTRALTIHLIATFPHCYKYCPQYLQDYQHAALSETIVPSRMRGEEEC